MGPPLDKSNLTPRLCTGHLPASVRCYPYHSRRPVLSPARVEQQIVGASDKAAYYEQGSHLNKDVLGLA